MREKQRRQKRLKIIITVITFIVLALVTYAAREQIIETISNLQEVNLLPVLLIIPLAMLNHLLQGKLYQGIFWILGQRFRTKPMMRLSLEMNFVNNVFPSAGLSGFSYIGLRLKNEGVPAGQAALVQVMRFVLLFVSFQVLLGVGLLLLAIAGGANNFVIMVTASLVTLLFVGTAFGVFIISSKQRINGFFTGLTKLLNWMIHLFRTKTPETIDIAKVERIFTELHKSYLRVRDNLVDLRAPLVYALLANLTEVLAVYLVFVAFGSVVNIGAVIIAYAVANFAGILSVLPGGVGVYEGLMTAVLVAAGVPVAISLPVIVAFRIVSMATQIPIGYFFYQKNIKEQIT